MCVTVVYCLSVVCRWDERNDEFELIFVESFMNVNIGCKVGATNRAEGRGLCFFGLERGRSSFHFVETESTGNTGFSNRIFVWWFLEFCGF